MTSRKRLRILLPAVALVVLAAIGLGAGYYFASASTDPPPVIWSVRPLNIKFSAGSTGSSPDSFTCNPSVSPVTLQAFSSEPDMITLSVSPTAFSICGSTPDNVVVTAACTSEAIAHNDCAGNMVDGHVRVCGPAPYTCLTRHLQVIVTVKNDNSEDGGD